MASASQIAGADSPGTKDGGSLGMGGRMCLRVEMATACTASFKHRLSYNSSPRQTVSFQTSSIALRITFTWWKSACQHANHPLAAISGLETRRRDGACARRLCDPTDRLHQRTACAQTPPPWPADKKACSTLLWEAVHLLLRRRQALGCRITSMLPVPLHLRPAAKEFINSPRIWRLAMCIMHLHRPIRMHCRRKTQSDPELVTLAVISR